jgi:hypothetical protein
MFGKGGALAARHYQVLILMQVGVTYISIMIPVFAVDIPSQKLGFSSTCILAIHCFCTNRTACIPQRTGDASGKLVQSMVTKALPLWPIVCLPAMPVQHLLHRYHWYPMSCGVQVEIYTHMTSLTGVVNTCIDEGQSHMFYD